MPSRADAGAGSNYPFLTAKERDNETGLDYFLARYYSSTQGRFTSPDEFTSGPDELYSFADVASSNPTFYSDLGTPQSLNKYQYTLNNPLRYTDPDGHCTAGQPCPAGLIVQTPTLTEVEIGAAKAIANIGLGMNNLTHAFTGWGEHVEPYEPSNDAQAVGMIVTDRGAFFAGLAGGRPQVGGILVAETKTTVRVLAQVGNAERAGGGATGAGTGLTNKNIVETIQKQGIKVTVNPRNAATAQEGNVTLAIGVDVRVNIRVETHPLKANGPPVRHANIDVIRTVRQRQRVVEKTHITQ